MGHCPDWFQFSFVGRVVGRVEVANSVSSLVGQTKESTERCSVAIPSHEKGNKREDKHEYR
jgi:hypothetical protein